MVDELMVDEMMVDCSPAGVRVSSQVDTEELSSPLHFAAQYGHQLPSALPGEEEGEFFVVVYVTPPHQ